MRGDGPQKPTDPRRVLRPGTDPDNSEMPVAQRILELAIRLRDRLRPRGRDPLAAFAEPRPVAEAVPGAWRDGFPTTTISRSGQRLTPDVALFHDASGMPKIEVSAGDSAVAVRVGAFDGGYLSLALDLPQPIRAGLAPGDTVELDFTLGLLGGSPLPDGVVLRLNLDTGGAPLQMEQTPPIATGPVRGVFVLADFGEVVPEAQSGWIDIVFTGVSETAVDLRTCRIVRAPQVPL